MQTFTEQFYINEKTFALVGQILFPDLSKTLKNVELKTFSMPG